MFSARDDVTICLLGNSGSGKSTLGNIFIGEEIFTVSSSPDESATTEV